jgi:hypothetical protein
MEEMTLEQIESNIRAAFDSVNLINETILLESNDENKDSVDRNFRHLEIMLSKEWFENALTPQQKTDIESAIDSGKTYVE